MTQALMARIRLLNDQLRSGVTIPGQPQSADRSAQPAAGGRPPAPTLTGPIRPRVTPDYVDPLSAEYISNTIRNQDSVPDSVRSGIVGHIHVSSLVNVCARQYALSALHADGGSLLLRQVTSADRLIWAQGKACEAHARDQFISARSREGVYGVWKCSCGLQSHQGLFPPSSVCGSCGTSLSRYSEPALMDDELGITGSPDLSFFEPQRKLHVVEIKSLGKHKTMMDLRAPKVEHRMQALMYPHLYERKGFAVSDSVTVLYVSREYSRRGSMYREFRINRQSEENQALLRTMLHSARDIHSAINSREIPARTVCQSISDETARSCPVASICFNMRG